MREPLIARDVFPVVYPITDRGLSGMTHTEQVRLLAEAGASLIQIREKHLSPRLFFEDAVEAVRIAHSLGSRIVINDRVDIALAARADGVHLGQTDLSPRHARRILGGQALVGYSTHSIAQARAALEEPLDYLAIGPVFDTSTKVDPDATVGLEALGSVVGICGELPVVAIGGITRDQIGDVIGSGASSVAVISAVADARAEMGAAFKSLMEQALSVKQR